MSHLHDIREMTRTQLREAYGSTYNSWRNMKERAKKGTATVHPEFQDFAHFLKNMGPKPTDRHTLDRINNDDPEYAPGKCRWLDKVGQANNRTTTIYLTVGDRTLPLTQWAEIVGLRPDTLRKRRGLGWTDQEIVYGKSGARSSGGDFPWLEGEIKGLWVSKFQAANRWGNRNQFEFYVREMGHEITLLRLSIDEYGRVLAAYNSTERLRIEEAEQYLNHHRMDIETLEEQLAELKDDLERALEALSRARAYAPIPPVKKKIKLY
ncbi:hypothetical protein [Pelagibacterium mangrovi]|uniref:hypothetical protein n=1 Tax=Pelagibacterium mangrovi TaxID=3119828 RepID=UPI002FCB61C1